ncbi:MAG: hypothetical protein ACRDO7_16965 [Nocardioidaceae bacterium]
MQDSLRRQRIRVWFGDEVVCTHEADPERARRYADLMSRRFAGLRVTIDECPDRNDAALPEETLWSLTVK